MDFRIKDQVGITTHSKKLSRVDPDWIVCNMSSRLVKREFGNDTDMNNCLFMLFLRFTEITEEQFPYIQKSIHILESNSRASSFQTENTWKHGGLVSKTLVMRDSDFKSVRSVLNLLHMKKLKETGILFVSSPRFDKESYQMMEEAFGTPVR